MTSTPTPGADPGPQRTGGPDLEPALTHPGPAASAPGRPPRRTVLAAGIPALAAVLGIAAVTGPRPAGLGDPSGDQQLTTALAPHLRGHRSVAAALVADGQVRFGGFGADEMREFEIGSVTKTFTGSLVAQAVERGEVSTASTVADLLGEQAAGSALADVALAELATHTSGLPSLAGSWQVPGFVATMLRKDPYAAIDADRLIADVLAQPLATRGTVTYSNLGVALLGQLLADVAGLPYAELLRERVLDPLGMSASSLPLVPEALADGAPTGHTITGQGAAAWTMNAVAPSGGLRSTAADMATYLTAMMDGTAPGAAAATEVLADGPADGSQVAMTWFHQDVGGERMIWHNGQTGGFAAFCGWLPETGRGVVLLSDTARLLDPLAADLLTGEVAP